MVERKRERKNAGGMSMRFVRPRSVTIAMDLGIWRGIAQGREKVRGTKVEARGVKRAKGD